MTLKKVRNILVTGGAGYIGSHMAKMLREAGCRVVVLDNLSTGHRDAVTAGELVVADLEDAATLAHVFARVPFDAVIHFASSSQVGESVRAPGKYYRNNVANTINLLNAAVDNGVRSFVFSSTAAIFGEPEYLPIDERHRQAPLNPYGASKMMVERMLADYASAHGLGFIALRYFNAAGADPGGALGERHEPETHLIPLVLRAASGRSPGITVYGRDYDTPDGTCIRDYVHVEDLCQAHLLALERLWAGGGSGAFNLGNGRGFSVADVIGTVQMVTRRRVPVSYGARRPGDPARLVADSALAREELGWRPRHEKLASIVEHAWRWELACGAAHAAQRANAPALVQTAPRRAAGGY